MEDLSNMMPSVNNDVREQANKRIQAILNDDEIKAFIEQHQLTQDEITASMSRFNEYLMNRDSGVNSSLGYNGSYVYVSYLPKDKETEMRMRDGIRMKSEYDEITEAFKRLTFNEVKLDKHNTPIVKAFQRQLDEYSYNSGKTGVWLYGKFGRGKSYLLGAVAGEYRKKGVAVTYISTVSLMKDVNKALDYKDYSAIRERVDSLKKAEVLILDDMGAENTRDYGYKSVLYDVFDTRAKNGLMTYFTSNLNINEFTELVKNRVAVALDAERMQERIEMLAKPIRLAGDNKRKKA
ncbi:ATP-binding protein [Aerococcaceae bacterium NML160702]|nr:ATP-binding protein [Aerococcaceae bacterium NML160702]